MVDDSLTDSVIGPLLPLPASSSNSPPICSLITSSTTTSPRFRKIDPDRWEFANEGFQKIEHIKRHRKNPHSMASHHHHHHSAAMESWMDVNNSTDFVETELKRLRTDQNALQSEVSKLRHQLEMTEIHLAEVKERLHIAETKQKHMEVVSQKEKHKDVAHASQDFLGCGKGEFTSDRSHVSHMQYEMADADPSPNGKAIDMEVENRPTVLRMQDRNLKIVICNGSAKTQNPFSVAPCMGNQIAADKSTQQNASEIQISDTTQQDGDMEQKKRKRGPLSKERRAKKKKKERINRAIKNRELGVKRLKLPPIVKQKKIVHCRHYLQGRCHEGERCKFSHDTIPLTKSKPCGHFARHTFTKRDDCPYDHDLSKYSCKNYTTNGFCNRGSDCLFSHEKPATQSSPAVPNALKSDGTPTKLTIPDKEGSFTASKVSKLDVKLPSSLSYLNSFKSTNEHGSSGTKIYSKPLPAGNSPNVSAGSASRTARKIPKGITFLLNGGTALGESSSSKLDGSSSKASVGDSTGLKAVDAPGSANNPNVKSGRAALKTPRGINFLSFAQPPSSESSSKGFSQLFPNRNNEPGKPVGENTGEGELTGSFLDCGGILRVNGQMNRSATCLVPGMNEIVNGAPVTMEQSINFSPVDEIVSRKRKEPSRQPQSSAAIASLSFIEPGDQSTGKQNADFSCSVKSSYLTNAPSSVQKAIKSTLAFAAKLETAIKIGSSLGREGS